jgi:hypothetical protein
MWRAIAVVLGLAAVSTTAVLAHHGWGTYDTTSPMTLTGPIRASKFENPHVTVAIKGGDKVWNVVLSAPSRLLNRGVTADRVGVGRMLSADGYPSTVDRDVMRATRITVDGKTIEMR